MDLLFYVLNWKSNFSMQCEDLIVHLPLKLMEIVLLNHIVHNIPYSLKCPYVAELGRGWRSMHMYFGEDVRGLI